MNLGSIWSLLKEPRSLSRSLFGRMVGVICLGIILIVGVAGTQVSQRINKHFDQQLVSGAHLLSNLMEEELQQIGREGKNGVTLPLRTALLYAPSSTPERQGVKPSRCAGGLRLPAATVELTFLVRSV